MSLYRKTKTACVKLKTHAVILFANINILFLFHFEEIFALLKSE